MGVFFKKCINMAVALCSGTAMVYGQAGLSKMELGINLSSYLYQGDLTPSAKGSVKTPGFGIMVFASKSVSPSFSLRTNLALGSIKGDDGKYASPAWRKQRNFSFRSPVFEISELLVWKILGRNNERGIAGFSPYLFGGIGCTFLDIRRDLSRYNAEYFADEPNVQAGLNADLAKPLPRSVAVLPVGVGIRYFLSPRFSAQAETSYRLTNTDYLDGFSKAANPRLKDQYSSFSVGIVYKFAAKNAMDCPDIVK
jgi:hypothetical protein